ncbi:MAG TPA: MMPL family transporter, partial [Phycisphaerae bacterium]|nr:MMPL family transporter [Phycisphaerae bacterium]
LEGTPEQPGLAQSPTGVPVLTGIAVQLYHSTESIRRAFLETTIMALIVVFILVFLDLRRIGQTLGTVSVLLLGLPMLIGIMGLLGLKWNFANFFAMPILIGAGHEYGVFLMHRYRETLHNPRRIWRFWDVSERALLLCAFVTCSSFAFLALTRDRGIASLGLVMAVGIGCIYLSAVFVVRPLLIWLLWHKGVYKNDGK